MGKVRESLQLVQAVQILAITQNTAVMMLTLRHVARRKHTHVRGNVSGKGHQVEGVAEEPVRGLETLCAAAHELMAAQMADGLPVATRMNWQAVPRTVGPPVHSGPPVVPEEGLAAVAGVARLEDWLSTHACARPGHAPCCHTCRLVMVV